ncbi:MAG: hypothetical protein P8N02_20410, partial [Actinomycetota bacterium]|nr:hypothetical protein [Actinomycetota bacterium]
MAALCAVVGLVATAAPGRAQAQTRPEPPGGLDERAVVVPESVVAGIEDLLAARSDEVRSGLIGQSLHPAVVPEVVERWNRAVAGFGALGIDVYEEELTEPVIDLTPPEVAVADNPTGPVYVVEVRRSWQVSGVDLHPASETLFLAVADTADGWAVVDDDPLRRVGLTSTRALWEVTEVEVIRDGGRVLVGAPSQRARM